MMTELAIEKASLMATITQAVNENTPLEELMDKVLENQPSEMKEGAYKLLAIHRLMDDFEKVYGLTSDPKSNKARTGLVDLGKGDMLTEHAEHILFIMSKATMIQDVWMYFLEINRIPIAKITTFPGFDPYYFLELIGSPLTSGLPFKYKRD